MKRAGSLIFAIVTLLLLSSCFRYKDIVYFNKTGVDSVYHPEYKDFKIKPGDLLYFSVYSVNDEVSKMFNADSRFVNLTYSPQALYLLGYTVNEEGYLNLPFVGDVRVSGLTIDSAQTLISKKIQDYFNDVNVKLKFISYNVSFLGEVNRPGRFNITGKRLSLMEGLALAGDMTVYADRTNVLIFRQNPDNTVTVRKVNLLKDDFMATKDFYLYPNDVVYVEPTKTKNLRLNAPNISIILSSISTLILVLSFISRM